ncbi:MAG TPA: rhodanese-like domain-containing protein [Gemmatimonadales bacterium]|nr:rhodanese-like domain-containing protein [Gemmatimonadales bacterium]
MRALTGSWTALAALATLTLHPGTTAAQDSCGERESPPGPLVSAEWLKRHRADSGLVLLHAERSQAPFDSAHIAGARFIAMGSFTTRRGELLTELPPVEQLDSLLESQGVGNRGRIVLYGETLPVTRLYFTLDYLGLGSRVSVMNGGLQAWRDAGGAVTAAATPLPPRAVLSVAPHPELVAEAPWIEAHRNDAGVLLVDARSREEFDGTKLEEGVSRPGHIPGAVNLDWTATLADGRFRELGQLRQLLTAAGAGPGKEIIAYCRVGTRASAIYFVARLLGYPVRIYDGSMNEWASLSALPVAKSDSGRP